MNWQTPQRSVVSLFMPLCIQLTNPSPLSPVLLNTIGTKEATKFSHPKNRHIQSLLAKNAQNQSPSTNSQRGKWGECSSWEWYSSGSEVEGWKSPSDTIPNCEEDEIREFLVGYLFILSISTQENWSLCCRHHFSEQLPTQLDRLPWSQLLQELGSHNRRW